MKKKKNGHSRVDLAMKNAITILSKTKIIFKYKHKKVFNCGLNLKFYCCKSA